MVVECDGHTGSRFLDLNQLSDSFVTNRSRDPGMNGFSLVPETSRRRSSLIPKTIL